MIPNPGSKEAIEMTDEYICKDCGHRAGDHAGNNRCLAIDCDCRDDPYLEQLTTLRNQLIELQADKVELISQRDTWIGLVMDKNKRLEVALTDLHDTTAQLVMDEEVEDALRKQLDLAVEVIGRISKLKDVTEIKGGFFDTCVPEHKITPDGYVTIPPQVKFGIDYVAKIADEALAAINRSDK
jgi:hypothetical protein